MCSVYKCTITKLDEFHLKNLPFQKNLEKLMLLFINYYPGGQQRKKIIDYKEKAK